MRFSHGSWEPGDPNYRKHYFALLKAVAKHIRAKSAWYRALAYIVHSGTNMKSPEGRLPKRCKANCKICNTKVWAKQGSYTPRALYEFYREQTALIAAEFPSKDMTYELIQDGFPIINDAGEC